ncbi:hypothetical protein PRIPAC_77559 [Pristionchus pacificus]|uniref:G protein-coupled receptor n=1 Tax=Pristionchus pacificus TaxID=54126 RepID=A0A2A6CB60_PRIPA|nr:hypothetical protein PRIPAC_77559 [Pristionchus pacificus]|eukprot:PDM75414.1 G protein-coupled receptor [Pristionchus pacificus]
MSWSSSLAESCPSDFHAFVRCISMQNSTSVPLCMGSIYPNIEERLFVGLPVLVLSLISTLLNVTLFRILLVQKSFLDANFRRHVFSLIFSCLGYISVNFYCFLPIVLIGAIIPDPWLIILASPNSSFFQTIQYSNVAISIDRFMIFCLPKIHKSMVSHQITRYILVVLPWVFSTLIVVHSSAIGYYKRVNPYTLKYTYECSRGGIYESLLFIFGFLWPSFMFFLYLVIFIFICLRKAAMSMMKRSDLLFILQFFIISMLQLFSSLFFNFAPKLMGDSQWDGLLMTFFSTLNTMNNPIVMVLFQQRVRISFIAMAKGGFIRSVSLRKLTVATPVTDIRTNHYRRHASIIGTLQ